MNKQFLGCATGVIGGLVGSGLLLSAGVGAFFVDSTWPVALIGTLVALASMIVGFRSAGSVRQSLQTTYTQRKYYSSLREIHELAGEIRQAATPEAMGDAGATSLRQNLDELLAQKDHIITALTSLDRFLADSRHRPGSLGRERRVVFDQLEQATSEGVRESLQQNLEAINKTEALVGQARTHRESLKAHLEQIRLALRNLRAQLVAAMANREVGGTDLAQVGEQIQREIQELASDISAISDMRVELESLETGKKNAQMAAKRQIT